MPDPEVPERAKRRSLTATEKLRILSEVDKAPAGQTAAILRREGIYSREGSFRSAQLGPRRGSGPPNEDDV